MKQITRVQELENLRQEAMTRIANVLAFRGSDYELIPLDWDEPTVEELEDIKSCPSFHLPMGTLAANLTRTRYVIALSVDRIGKEDILIDTCDILGNDEQTFRIGKADLPCILAIADRIDYLEETGIHTPDPEPTKIIRERDTFNPENL